MKCYQPRIETQVLCLQNYNSVLNTLCSTVNVISSYTNWIYVHWRIIISLHIRSMWETICDAQAGLCTHSSNSKICVQILQKAPFWNFRPERPPPPEMENFRFEMTKVYSKIPPPNGKLQIWDDQSLLQNTPPPNGLESGRSYVETNLYPPWIPLVVSVLKIHKLLVFFLLKTQWIIWLIWNRISHKTWAFLFIHTRILIFVSFQ